MALDIEKIRKKIDFNLEECFTEMHKEDCKESIFINYFWNTLEYCYGEVLKFVKNKIKEVDFDNVPIEDLLYDDKDEERIKTYYAGYKNESSNSQGAMKFLQELTLIFDTESVLVMNGLFRAMANQAQIKIKNGRIKVQVYSTDDEAECGELMMGDYFWDEDISCGHPGCDCYIIDIWIDAKEAGELGNVVE